jgi:hypothetical protein
VSGQRKALIVANGEYEQEALRDLAAPAADAEALGRVLGDEQEKPAKTPRKSPGGRPRNGPARTPLRPRNARPANKPAQRSRKPLRRCRHASREGRLSPARVQRFWGVLPGSFH